MENLIYHTNNICDFIFSSEAMLWIENPNKFIKIKESFNSTSRFAQLKKVHIRIAGRLLFIRFVATTGDAMGMNMVSKVKSTSSEFYSIFNNHNILA